MKSGQAEQCVEALQALHAKRKPHPWRQHNPGAFKSDYDRNEKTVPAHARPVRKDR